MSRLRRTFKTFAAEIAENESANRRTAEGCRAATFAGPASAMRKAGSKFLADPEVGTIRSGCNPLLAAAFVSAVVDRLSRRYPRIVFRLVTAYAETLHRELTERKVDLLINTQIPAP
jgi:DNA-binding transcriptional LysR family regulator